MFSNVIFWNSECIISSKFLPYYETMKLLKALLYIWMYTFIPLVYIP